MRLYVASSWKNTFYPVVIHELRYSGHEVYDFRRPHSDSRGFHWSEVDQNWQSWGGIQYRAGLTHPVARRGFQTDFDAMQAADAFVGVAPFGRSASMEMGWAAGAGKPTLLYLPAMFPEPELMASMFDHICVNITEVIETLDKVRRRRRAFGMR
jgi:hypothetical protein